jgi:hypothetical protein
MRCRRRRAPDDKAVEGKMFQSTWIGSFKNSGVDVRWVTDLGDETSRKTIYRKKKQEPLFKLLLTSMAKKIATATGVLNREVKSKNGKEWKYLHSGRPRIVVSFLNIVRPHILGVLQCSSCEWQRLHVPGVKLVVKTTAANNACKISSKNGVHRPPRIRCRCCVLLSFAFCYFAARGLAFHRFRIPWDPALGEG